MFSSHWLPIIIALIGCHFAARAGSAIILILAKAGDSGRRAIPAGGLIELARTRSYSWLVAWATVWVIFSVALWQAAFTLRGGG
jgi:hypothetical protein